MSRFSPSLPISWHFLSPVIGRHKKCCLMIGYNVSEMINEWGAYAGNIVTNHKTAIFVSTNHRARKVPGDREGEREEGREGERERGRES